MNTRIGGSFRILRSTPHGRPEPGNIRTASIGLVLPIEDEVDGYYVVRRDVFIQTLSAVGTKEAKEAVLWWRHDIRSLTSWRVRRFGETETLLFPKEDVETIERFEKAEQEVPKETKQSFLSLIQ